MNKLIRFLPDPDGPGGHLLLNLPPVGDTRHVAILELHVVERAPGESWAWWFNERGELLWVREVGRI